MKTPNAVLIGLTLIAAAIYFKDTAGKPTDANDNPATKSDVKSVMRDWLNRTRIEV